MIIDVISPDIFASDSDCVVVIDVWRSFTTAAYAFAAGACEILITGSVEEAMSLRVRFPQAVLMGMGTLATVGALKPKNFIHVVFDNEVYGTTGNQPTISSVVPLEKVAKAAGYVNVERVLDRDDLVYEFKDMLKKDGPSMLLIKVNEFVEDAGRVLHEPADITTRFMKAIE